ncbi:MAG TPA: NmrA family NAD(P)-binding protein, partial [Vicinamibacterales bacterium]
MAKVIAVIGATGGQGGGLCRAILADSGSGFSCRAITRDPSKDKAKALAAAGAEVVAADLDDVESLKMAFAGAHGVFAVTTFWEHFSAEKEKAQAKNIADAAKAAGVQHVIWSTLEDTRQWMKADDARMPMLQGSYRVPHFDAKAEANAFFAGVPTTFL